MHKISLLISLLFVGTCTKLEQISSRPGIVDIGVDSSFDDVSKTIDAVIGHIFENKNLLPGKQKKQLEIFGTSLSNPRVVIIYCVMMNNDIYQKIGYRLNRDDKQFNKIGDAELEKAEPIFYRLGGSRDNPQGIKNMKDYNKKVILSFNNQTCRFTFTKQKDDLFIFHSDQKENNIPTHILRIRNNEKGVPYKDIEVGYASRFEWSFFINNNDQKTDIEISNNNKKNQIIASFDKDENVEDNEEDEIFFVGGDNVFFVEEEEKNVTRITRDIDHINKIDNDKDEIIKYPQDAQEILVIDILRYMGNQK
ncbi:MAG: hypothetical protein ACRCVW_03205 [Brevinema sp.]